MKERSETTTDSSREPSRDDAQRLATVLTASPNLRAKLFANPTKVVGKQIPRRKYWDYGIEPQWFIKHPVKFQVLRHAYRAKLAKLVLEEIADGVTDGTLSTSVNTDAVFQEHFEPVARVSQRSFNGIFYLSVAAFVAGCALIGAGIWIAVDPPSAGNSTVLASIFGATGAASALGSIYAMVIRGISNATSEHARLRLVLTGFSTELGQLRAHAEGIQGSPVAAGTIESVEKVNLAVSKAMVGATKLIPADSARKRKSKQQTSQQLSSNGGPPKDPEGQPIKEPETA